MGTIDAPNWQFGAGVKYKFKDRGTGAWGVKNSPGAGTLYIETFEDNPSFILETYTDNGSSNPWAFNNFYAYAGIYSFMSAGSIGTGDVSDATANLSPGAYISFYYRMELDADDTFEFYMDADLIMSVPGSVTADWQLVTFPTTGYTDHTFRVVRGSGDENPFGNRVFVDNVTFSDGAPPTEYYWPLQLDETGALLVATTGGAVNLSCETDSVTICGDEDNPIPVTFQSEAVIIFDTLPSSSTVTSVNDSATSVTLCASNAFRVALYVFNDSDQILYLKLGATASLTSFTTKVLPQGFYELPDVAGFIYVGVVDGIWAANSTGAARITELTN